MDLTRLRMPFHRRGMRPVIHTRKEIIDSTLLGVAAATTSTVVLATAVNDYVGTVGTVEVGSLVSSMFLFVQIIPTASTENVDWYIAKIPANVVLPIPGATGGTPGRRFILHEEKGIPGNSADGAYPATFKGVIKVPKGRQRFAEDDVIQLRLRGVGIHNICVKSIYKSRM